MKHILITGVSSGIGFITAQELCAIGYHVFGSVRSGEDAKRLETELGTNFTPLIFDVTDSEAIQKAAALVEEQTADTGLSALINNAGIAVSGILQHIELEEFKKQFEVNLFGVLAVTQAFLPMLGAVSECPFPPGKIINIGSVSGQIAYPFIGPYVASKFALEGFSHSLRRELLLYGIDVILVGPGSVRTPIWEKESATTIPEHYLKTGYARALKRFQRQFVKAGENGLPPVAIARRIIKIIEKRRPAVRQAVVRHKFTRWVIPRYLLSARMLDRLIGKLFGK